MTSQSNSAWLRITSPAGDTIFDCIHSPCFPSRQWEWTSGNAFGTCETVPELCRVASQIMGERCSEGVVEGHYASEFELHRRV
jgi:hypothetical protein